MVNMQTRLEKRLGLAVMEGDFLEDGNFRVYKAGRGVVAKSYQYLYDAQNAFNIGKEISENGVSTPEVIDVVTLGSSGLCPVETHFLLMERVYGMPLNKIRGHLKRRLEDEYIGQLIRVLDMGNVPCDCNEVNGVYCIRDDSVYLLDFDSWLMDASRAVIARARKSIMNQREPKYGVEIFSKQF